MNIYVGNLAYGVTDADLRDAFSASGEVTSASVITDKFSGQSKGFGFVEMPNKAQGEAAIKALRGKGADADKALESGDFDAEAALIAVLLHTIGEADRAKVYAERAQRVANAKTVAAAQA